MILMLDIGNTNIVIGIFKGGKVFKTWRISSEIKKTEDEYWALLNTFFNNQNISYQKIKGICISSVVPDLDFPFKRMASKYLSIEPLFIHSGLDLGLNILYDYPGAVGADRICNSVAAKAKYGFPLVIIDFGTATTFDCLNSAGDYLGGIICPGLESASEILHYRAAKLPKIELKFPKKVIGDNTEESIQSGVMYGTIAMIEGIIIRIKKILGDNTKVIATGGLAYLITQQSKSIDFFEENLNLEGIYLIYQRNKQ